MKQKFVDAFMDVAARFAALSSARRLQVGAIIVKDSRIISIGYNGMPAGWDNNCEDEIIDSSWMVTTKTKPEVLHAETNAIAKLARSSESGEGSTLFVTHAPCLDCAKLVYQSGISTVYFRHQYRNDAGINFLQQAGIDIIQHNDLRDI